MGERRVGIVVGGGPAPGINAVIGAATIEAINNGLDVVGIYDGFRWLCSDTFDPAEHTTPLEIKTVARIHFDGGSILRTSRTSLLDPSSVADGVPAQPDATKLDRLLDRFKSLGITDLITIGGDDTALSSRFVSEAAGGDIHVVHVPKTIDNDLPLPHNVSTFGFSTARYFGTQIVKNLMQDSLTTGRWYLVTVMGRTAGWLALSIGQSASATITLVPEEFEEKVTIQHIADVLEGSMLKRQSMGRSDGVAVVAEGLAYKLGDKDEIEQLLGRNVPVDAAGHMRLADVPLGYLLRCELERRFQTRNQKISMVTHMLGYELRSADPTPFDMSYCRTLGHGCIQLLHDQHEGRLGACMVTLIDAEIVPMTFESMVDPDTNRTRVRRVDTTSQQYNVARAYMIRLERADLDRPDSLKRLSEQGAMTPDTFRDRYQRAATRLHTP